MFNPLKYFRNRKVGLALGSGGVKGCAHISVIEYLESQNIPIDMIAGSSSGAIMGALYCMGTMYDFRDDLFSMSRRDMLKLFDPVFPSSGLLEGNKFYDFLKKYIPGDEKIENLPIPLGIVATDYFSGEAIVFQSGNILDAVRASISVPGVLVPVKYNETFLVDGGVANSLPINIVKDMGAGITIGVNLHPYLKREKWNKFVTSHINSSGKTQDSDDIEIVREKRSFSLPLKASDSKYFNSIERWLGIGKYNKKKEVEMPNIFEAFSQTIDIMEYINTQHMLKLNSPSVIIEPDALHVRMLDFTKISSVVDAGKVACEKVSGKIKRNVINWL